ncbi:MAG TPA: biotin/lipoyl-binding protein, partial [Rhodobacteraceae bacterium]|nr:biotin/lipoyl-binding protein [Paracoccaceae bacterium]
MRAATPPEPRRTRSYVCAGFSALLLLIGGFGTWAAFTRISGAIVTPGQVEASRQIQYIQSPQGGVVVSVPVMDGSHVDKDQALLVLDDQKLRRERAALDRTIFEVRARRATVEAEIKGTDTIDFGPDILRRAAADPEFTRLLKGHREILAAVLQSRQQETLLGEHMAAGNALQAAALQAQLDAAQRQLDLMRAKKEEQTLLVNRGLVPQNTLRALESSKAELQGKIAALQARLAHARELGDEARLGLVQRQAARKEELLRQLRDLAFRESELAGKIVILQERIASMTVRAPDRGIVLGLENLSP